MGRIRLKAQRWKGSHKIYRMRLVEFKADEAELFQALSIVFFGADVPEKGNIKASIKAEDEFSKYPEIKDSAFKPVRCPFCRTVRFTNPRICTLPDGKGADLILDDKVFDYILGRFDAWQQIEAPKLKRPYVELQERFEAAKTRKGFDEKPLDDFKSIQVYIEKRDNSAVTT